MTDTDAIASTRRWIERAVIGLNLCPFAKLPYSRGAIRYRFSTACDTNALIADLRDELAQLVSSDPLDVETTLIIHPNVLGDFLDYNDFLDQADELLRELELDGILQIASFHPQYQFAGTHIDAPENNSNRSPFPTLHLLRESSIERVIDAGIDVATIPEVNIERLRILGNDGWRRLWDEKPLT